MRAARGGKEDGGERPGQRGGRAGRSVDHPRRRPLNRASDDGGGERGLDFDEGGGRLRAGGALRQEDGVAFTERPRLGERPGSPHHDFDAVRKELAQGRREGAQPNVGRRPAAHVAKRFDLRSCRRVQGSPTEMDARPRDRGVFRDGFTRLGPVESGVQRAQATTIFRFGRDAGVRGALR